jgi:CHAT domain-containing protein/tetratricopeptide (TPR) repeat protein
MDIAGRLALLAWVSSFGLQDPPRVEIEVPLVAEVVTTDPTVSTATIAASYTDAPVRGRTCRFTATEDGAYTIVLRSIDFDAYLIVRRDDGSVLAEDDDSLVLTDARVVVSLAAGAAVTIDACALHGQTGAFELTARRGSPPQQTAADRAAAEIEAWRARIRAIEQRHGTDSPALIEPLNALGVRLWQSSRSGQGLEAQQRALALCEQAFGPGAYRTGVAHVQIAQLLSALGRHAEAERAARDGLAILEASTDEHRQRDILVDEALIRLGTALGEQGRDADAIDVLERLVERRFRRLGELHTATRSALAQLTEVAQRSGQSPRLARFVARLRSDARGAPEADPVGALREAERMLLAGRPAEALAIAERLRRSEEPAGETTLLATSLQAEGSALLALGRAREAELALRRSADLFERTEPGRVGAVLLGLATARFRQGALQDAEAITRRALAALDESATASAEDRIVVRDNLATVLEQLGRPREALGFRREVVELRSRQGIDSEARRLELLLELGRAEYALSDWAAAVATFREAVTIAERATDIDPMRRAYAFANLARALAELSASTDPGPRAEAETWFRRSLELYVTHRGADHPETAAMRAEWGGFLAQTGRVADGEREIRAGLAAAQSGGSPAAIRRIEQLLAQVLLDSGRASAAEPLLRSCLASLEREIGPASFDLFGDLRILAICLVQLAKFDEAQALAARAQRLAAGTGDPLAAVWADELAIMAAQGSATPREMEALLRGALLRAADAGVAPGSMLVENFENGLAVALAEDGRDAEAEPILRKLLAGAEARLGDGHPVTSRYRINLAHVLASLRRFDEARELAAHAVNALERIEGQELWLTDALVCVGTIDRFTGHDRAAVPSLRRALALREAHLPAEHPQVIQLWADLSGVLGDEPAEAERYARRAVDAAERVLGADSPQVAQYLAILAELLAGTEQEYDAVKLLRRALTIFGAHLGPDHIETCACALDLARMLGYSGDPEAARQLLDQNLPRVESGLTTAPERWRKLRRRVATALEVTGAFAEAEGWIRPRIEESTAVFGPDSPALVSDLKTLANLLLAQGRLGEAEASLRRVLALAEAADGPDAYGTTGLLFDLAMLLDAGSRTGESLELMRRNVAIRRRCLGDAHPGTRTSVASLASLLGRSGELGEADRLLDEVLDGGAAQQLDRLAYAQVLNLRTLLRLGLGAPDALDWARRAGAVAASGPQSLISLSIQANVAVLEALRGDRARARELALAAWGGQIETALPQIGRWSAQDRFFAVAQARSVGDLLGHVTDLAVPVDVTRLFDVLAATRGAAFRADRGARLADTAPDDEALDGLVDRLRSLAARQSTLAFARDVEDPKLHADRLRALAADERRAELELLQRRPMAPDAWTAVSERIQAALPERTALLAFAMLIPIELRHVADAGGERPAIPGRMLAFVVDGSGVRSVDLGEAEPLREATDTFLREIRSGAVADGGLRAARNDRLRTLLWEPLEPLLAGAATVFVAPDAFLARLPLGVLADAQGRYLVEDRIFVYASDPLGLLDGLATAPAGRTPDPDVLVVGDVDYAARSTATPFVARADRAGFAWDWAPLPGTARECEAVAGAARGGSVTVLRGPTATEEQVKARAGSANFLHFATHGFFEPTGVPSLADAAQRRVAGEAGAMPAPGRVEPALEGHAPDLLSGLVLAGANRPQPDREDGYLTAKEVGYLDLSGCELVVLSGCETGVGTSRGGEAMLGLRRAFHTAGARTVIASLWKVGDQTTRELMTAFYRQLWGQGEAPAAALRAAQIEMLSRQRAAGRVDPGAWGAFALSGDWR